MIERNPFLSSILLSIGQNIFAIWSESNQSAPVLWRRRETNITCAQWSPTRVSLFFIARYDGIIELWDLLTRSDDACISHNAGTTLITVISQHKLSLPTDILMIADQRANLRAFTLPSMSQPKDNDLDVNVLNNMIVVNFTGSFNLKLIESNEFGIICRISNNSSTAN